MHEGVIGSERVLAVSLPGEPPPGTEPRVNAHAAATERDLIERTRSGEQAAFAELVSRTMRRAYFAALGLVGSHEDALDLSQEAFVRAYKARARLDPARPFFPWLYQIIRRLCFNFTRDSGARRRNLNAAAPWLVAEASSRARSDDPASLAERHELCRRVQDALKSLGERDREVLVLKEFEGLRYREIAELLDIPLGTVMSRLYSARRHLAAAMGENR